MHFDKTYLLLFLFLFALAGCTAVENDAPLLEPSADATSPAAHVLVNEANQIFLNGKEVTLEELAEELRTHVDAGVTATHVSIDGRATMGAARDVQESIRSSGITHVRYDTNADTDDEPYSIYPLELSTTDE